MASGISVDVQGIKEINNLFMQLPKQLDQDKIWAKFWKANSKPLLIAAKSQTPIADKEINYPSDPSLKIAKGTLRDSIQFYRTRASKKVHGGYIGPRVKGKFKKNKGGYFGAFVEYGHKLKHGGSTQPNPFMERAWKQAHLIVLSNGFKDAENIFVKAVKSHEKRMAKYGSLGY